MSTTASDASSAPRPEDPLATLAALPGVPGAVESVRKAVDRVYGHRVMRRRGNAVTAEAALRAARGSAALSGADWALEEVRRRSDFGSDAEARTVGAALRLNAEAGQLLSVWSQSPLRVLARLHLVAAGGAGVSDRTVGRPRLAGEPVVEAPGSGATALGAGASSSGAPSAGAPSVEEAPVQVPLAGTPLPDADEVAARLDGLARLVIATSAAPALVTAAVVHGELLALRPFGSYNGLVARAAERVVLIGSGLDPKAICPAEVGHAELGRAAYAAAFDGYLSGTPEGMAAWITHCGRAVELGVRESTAVCEALQRGAA
ncbi:oxidoreductase [Streptomyces sp. JV176]|uniref:oxidoreductase n=1 Tax=Streptomyces sp. JV176 TaxID=858630 RepID=UPI002E764D43|nr:oxidoreductase [Streptomyces sp. JV176]MEE1799728.1 oxidoreductase [Streptomyces sp. JV176]